MFRAIVFVALLVASPAAFAVPDKAELRDQVEAAERAFAKTMADRDHEAFTTFLSEETIFVSSPKALRGKQQVADHWRAFFIGPEAPFSWEPEMVEVLDSGTLALTTGPVYNPGGMLISNFTSIWRQEAPGVWKIVLDKGNQICPPRPCPTDRLPETDP
ncbi:MAG: nuclear transport factor 2 family protein [bacterium]|nr:nuclear transport factor 2 family protein [bacterium]